MTARTILLHLRLPFSVFLLPVFLFALTQSPEPDTWRTAGVFFILHFLLYPASNAYNSYFDKDEGSIGGLEAPPPVGKELFYVAWVLDIVALGLGAYIGWPFVAYLLIYGFISKAYSHPAIRLKKYPVASWLIVSLFQGGFTYMMTLQAINSIPVTSLLTPQVLLASALCTLNLLALYPITQVYQHDEDARRGDLTMSRLLGIRGTFISTAVIFSLSAVGFYRYFGNTTPFYLFLLFLFPSVAFFLRWSYLVWRDERRANFRLTMQMTLIAGLGLNFFFMVLWFLHVPPVQ